MTNLSKSSTNSSEGLKEITVVEVRYPINHENKSGRKLFTDYEICIKTTSKAFMIPQSVVRRRYSDFVWLKSWLEKNNESFSDQKMPKLPPKKLIRKFDDEFLNFRQKGLQKFLRKVIERNIFLSDKALHLFLQSGMPVKQIQDYLDGKLETNSFNNADNIYEQDYEKQDNIYEQNYEKQDTCQQSSRLQEIPILDKTLDDNGSIGPSSSFGSISSSSALSSSFEKVNIDDCSLSANERNTDSRNIVGNYNHHLNNSEEHLGY